MSTSSDTPRPRRAKAKLTEAALANRLAATLDPKVVEAAAQKPAESAPSPKRVAAEPAMAMEVADPAPAPVEAMPAKPPVAAAPGTLFGASVDRLTGAVSSVQEMARDTARSLADTRLVTAHSIVAFQKKLLEMVHANLDEGFMVAQKIVTAPNMGEAIKVQSSFASARVKTLTDQAAELRSLSAQLAEEARQPWTAHMTKSLKRMKSGLNA
jgi:phasin family protein